MAINAIQILDMLHAHFMYDKNCEIAAANTYALKVGFESDFVAVTQSQYIHEVEVKISKQDFKADFKKSKMTRGFDKSYGIWKEMEKHEMIATGNHTNYFWFCLPRGVIDESDIPEHAGYIEIVDREVGFDLNVVKKAPLLHKNKTDIKVKYRIAKSMTYKAWALMSNQIRGC